MSVLVAEMPSLTRRHLAAYRRNPVEHPLHQSAAKLQSDMSGTTARAHENDDYYHNDDEYYYYYYEDYDENEPHHSSEHTSSPPSTVKPATSKGRMLMSS